MRTTVDIPDPIYRRLKAEAALEGRSAKDLLLSGVIAGLRERKIGRKGKRISLPLIDSKRPGWLRLSNREINAIL